MTKLDEIEAINNVLTNGASRADVELLIRAVRQLGEFRKWVIERPSAPIAPEHLIFPDVMELLENNDRVGASS